MTYLSLYRRRRPLTFSDMTGQEHVTRTLKNSLIADRLAHAYLFCGPRGTGKTTAAKILARAMNCEQYPTADPCGKCPSCCNIAAGVSIDVIEMDAASNRGIDEIRELREKSRFASGESRYKVYIIDEAHMLTAEACNAFLKTLEEPPRSVVFILATTDPSRLPLTIVSRCQRFDFHLLSIEQIRSHLEAVIGEEGWTVDEEALSLIARLADGSLRDALGILEQCSAYGEKQIEAEQVRFVTGATRIEAIAALVEAMVTDNLNGGLKILGELVYSGRDLNLLLRDLIFIFSRLLLDGSSDDKESGSKHGFEELISSYRGRVARHKLFDCIELLHEVSGDIRHAHFPLFILEVAFIRLLRLLHSKTNELTEEEIKETADEACRSAEAEERSPEPDKMVTGDEVRSGAEVKETARQESGGTAVTAAPGAEGSSLDELKENWPRIVEEIKRRQKSTAAWLEPALLLRCQGNLVKLGYRSEYAIHQARIMEENHRKLVEETLSLFFKRAMILKTASVEPGAEEGAPGFEDHNSSTAKGSEKSEKKAPGVEEAMKIFGGKIIDPQ